MATDLERLVVSFDANLKSLENKLIKAGLLVKTTADGMDRDTARAGRRVAENLSKHTGEGGAGAFSYVQKQELGHIAKSLADQIAAGASPLRALEVEGGRIVELFSSGSGGVGGTLKALGSTLAGIASPAALATAGVLGIGLAAAFAYRSFEEAERGIRLGLLGIGAASGATVSDIRRIGDELAASQGISAGAGQDIALSLAKTGRIDVSQIGDVGRLAKGYAALTGTDLPTAGKQLADIFGDPVRGAEKLNDILGTLDGKTLAYIQTLSAQGRVEEAIGVLLGNVTPEITKAAEATGFWASAWEKVSAAAEKAGHVIATSVGTAGTKDQIESLTRTADNLEKVDPLGNADYIAELRRQAAELQAKQRAEDEAAKARTAAVRTNLASDKIDADLHGVDPAADRIRDLENRIAAIKRALAQPGVAEKTDGGADRLKADQAGLEAQLAQLKQTAAAGGEAVEHAAKDASFKEATAGLDGYALKIREIHHDVEEMRRSIVATADAAGLKTALAQLPGIEASRIAAARTAYENQDSKYSKSVGDAPEKYQDLIYSAAARSNIDPNLLTSLLARESGFDPDVIAGRRKSAAGAIGIAQFLPGTAADEGVNPYDPASSIAGAARYLRKLIDQFDGDVQAGVAAYNHGAGNVRHDLKTGTPLPEETRKYLDAIFTPAADYKQQAGFSKTLADKQAAADAQVAEARDGSTKKTDQARIATELLAEAQAKGLTVTAELKAAIDAEAASLANAARAVSEAQAARAVSRQRQDLGLSRDEAGVQNQVRGYGLDPESGAGAALAEQLRQIQIVAETKSEATSFVEGITHALIEGKDAAQAFHDALLRLTEKVADKAIDAGISSLFSAGTGAGGIGGIAALFGIGHAEGTIVRGPGGPTADRIPALLSAGEAVLPAVAVRQNPALVQALIAGRYAAGGVIGALPAIPPATSPRASTARSQTFAPVLQIDARGAQAGVADQIAASLQTFSGQLPAMLAEHQARFG